LSRIVYDFADYWSVELGEAGIPSNRICIHIAFPVFPRDQQQNWLNQLSINLGFATNILGFTHTTPSTAFNQYSSLRFSTYPIGFKENDLDSRLARIVEELPKHNIPHWADVEGTNVQGDGEEIITSHIS
jgi:hypothetical protein